MATRGEIIKYTLLPGIIPRIAELFQSGFMHLAMLIAIVYANVRLLPPNHPYLNPQNAGRFGIRHVVSEAANNLVFSRRNIDQIIIFFTILAGLVLLAFQFILLIVAATTLQPAYAIGIFSPGDLFSNPSPTGSLGPQQDLAFIVMDRVFGVVGFFNSCVSDLGTPCTDMNGDPLDSTPTAYPFPFHIALHQMLEFYALGIFVVGVFVIIYYVITIVAETAQTGTPFGQRFSKAWAPIRLIAFFALIIPINIGETNDGFNMAQLIVFKTVQMGSNLATNGWAYFNTGGPGGSPEANYLSQQKDIIGRPNIPEVNDLLHAVFVTKTCSIAYQISRRTESSHPGRSDGEVVNVKPYLVRAKTIPGVAGSGGQDALDFLTTDYTAASQFSQKGAIKIRIGERDTGQFAGGFTGYDRYAGKVKPLCGEITLQTYGDGEPGAHSIFEGYYDVIKDLWRDTSLAERAECLAKLNISSHHDPNCTPPDKAWAQSLIETYTERIRTNVENSIDQQLAEGDFNLPPGLLERGWAGAALWYNRVAEMNGAITSATLNIPRLSELPFLMQLAMVGNSSEDAFISLINLFKQNRSDREGFGVLQDIEPGDRELLIAMTHAHDFWVEGGSGQRSTFTKPAGNIVIDFANAVFGTSGIFEMRKNTDVHPLAQLTSLGKGMMDATLRNTAYGAAFAGVSGFTGLIDETFSKALAKSGSDFMFSMALTTMGIAAVLYYVLPFLPFLYFLFALSGWVKSIFEAIVAMPLWALGHLRIEGDGLPGPGGANGYYLLLEIFLRPILIVFGLLASISVFAALVNVLNQVFDLVVANAGGFDHEMEVHSGIAGDIESLLTFSRGPIDIFFFTAMYAIICYLIGLACFKLVDLIPNKILRWIGSSVTTLQENAGDPAGQLSQNVYKGTLLVGNQISGQVKGDLAVLANL